MQGYGLTETSPVITAGRLDDNRVGTVGKAIFNVEIRIAEDGEIEVRGPNIMRYYNKPEGKAGSVHQRWLLKTGDIGTIDEDGFLRITDRKEELFKTSGGVHLTTTDRTGNQGICRESGGADWRGAEVSSSVDRAGLGTARVVLQVERDRS